MSLERVEKILFHDSRRIITRLEEVISLGLLTSLNEQEYNLIKDQFLKRFEDKRYTSWDNSNKKLEKSLENFNLSFENKPKPHEIFNNVADYPELTSTPQTDPVTNYTNNLKNKFYYSMTNLEVDYCDSAQDIKKYLVEMADTVKELYNYSKDFNFEKGKYSQKEQILELANKLDAELFHKTKSLKNIKDIGHLDIAYTPLSISYQVNDMYSSADFIDNAIDTFNQVSLEDRIVVKERKFAKGIKKLKNIFSKAKEYFSEDFIYQN